MGLGFRSREGRALRVHKAIRNAMICAACASLGVALILPRPCIICVAATFASLASLWIVHVTLVKLDEELRRLEGSSR
ncbi:MAG: hypothetical protein GXO32_01370 [Crenarchaeota archaeon]|nr:hypothetical protein [Thermoproteota archaeon]